MKKINPEIDDLTIKLWRLIRQKYLRRFTPVPLSPVIFASKSLLQK